jgi:hypothetical protein
MTMDELERDLDERDKAQAAGKVSALRDRVIAETLAGVPAVYHAMVPHTGDESALRYAADHAKAAFQGDRAAAPPPRPDVAPADLANKSPHELITMGLAATPPARDAALLQAQQSDDNSEYYGFAKPSEAAASQAEQLRAEAQELAVRAVRAARFENERRHQRVVA